MYKLKEEDKTFVVMLRTICVPIILQNMLGVLVNLIDSFMVGTLGDTAVAAVGVSNQVFLVLNLIILGVASGIAIFMAQYWGKKDIAGLQGCITLGLSFIVPIAMIASIACFLFPENIFKVFIKDISVILSGISYQKIISFSYVPIAISIFLSYLLRSIDKIKYSVIATCIALFINVVLNYLLIFGIGIFPKLGIAGAAIATNIARYLQVVILLCYIYKLNMPIAIKSLSLIKSSSSIINKFIKTSGTVFLNEALYGLGSALLVAVYGRMGTHLLAGANIAKTIENLVWIFFWSLCAAASVSIGNLIGEEQYEKANRYAYKFITTSIIASIILSLLLLASHSLILSFYNVSPKAILGAKTYLYIFMIAILFRGPTKVLTGGVLRSGGDTLFVLIWDVVPLFIALLTCYVLTTYFSVSVLTILLISIGYEIVKVIPILNRVRSKIWINNLVK